MKINKYLLLVTILLIAVLIFYILIPKTPQNDKDWEAGYQTKSYIGLTENSFTINNLRDWEFNENGPTSTSYIDKQTYNLEDLEKIWFVVVPFSNLNVIAHTYFIFDFKDRDSIALSIEARREKNEKYNWFWGTFNKYELYYVWGTERDITGTRVIWQQNNVYKYPLILTKKQQRTLLTSVIEDTNSLYSTPKVYNTFTSNCTNNLAKAANKVNSNSIPKIYYLTPPGVSVQVLRNLGYIRNDITIEELKDKYIINKTFKENYTNKNLSKEIRTSIE